MEKLKTILVLFSTVAMGVCVWFYPEVSTEVSFFYVLLLSTYLSIDIWGMIKKTKELPSGEFAKIKTWRYLVCGFSLMGLLIINAITTYRTQDINGTETFGIMIAALFVVISAFIGALEGNKLATGNPEGKQSE